MNSRLEFKRISRLRNKEAQILLENDFYSGAYYLYGYSIECALKACIAKSYEKHVFPNKKKVQDSHTHNLEQLLKIAQLTNQFKQDSENNPNLRANWAVVKDWKETSRYEVKSDIQAADIKRSINHRQNGILKWIRQYW